jgi:hypothetical protein
VSFPALESVGSHFNVRRAQRALAVTARPVGQRAALTRRGARGGAPRAQMFGNGLLAEALFPALASMGSMGSMHSNAAGFVFGSSMVPSQTGAALDGTNCEDQPAADVGGSAYLWRSLVFCADCECSADACTKDTLVERGTSTPCAVGADGVLGHTINVRAGEPRRRPRARHAAQQPCRSARSRCEAGGRGGTGGPGRTQPLSCARPDPATPRHHSS